MNNTLKNIPKEFLKNTTSQKENNDFYITSTSNELKKNNDNIWLFIVLSVVLDII